MIDYNLSKLSDQILRMLTNAALADHTRFGTWLASVLTEEELRRERTYGTNHEQANPLVLISFDDSEVAHVVYELGNAEMNLRCREHENRLLGFAGIADELLEARRLLCAISDALVTQSRTIEYFMADMSARAIN